MHQFIFGDVGTCQQKMNRKLLATCLAGCWRLGRYENSDNGGEANCRNDNEFHFRGFHNQPGLTENSLTSKRKRALGAQRATLKRSEITALQKKWIEIDTR